MAQTQRPLQPVDLQPDMNSTLVRSPSGTNLLMIKPVGQLYTDKSCLEFTLTIRSAEDGVKPLTLLTQDVQSLQFVLAECKRLKEIAGMSPLVVTSSIILA